MIRILSIILLFLMIMSCGSEDTGSRQYLSDTSTIKLLEEISPSESGISFNNQITEDEVTNAITFDGMLQGAGVAVLDANNDGLMDIFFPANMGGDKLYINEGGFKFKDVTNKSGIKNINWSTGAAVVDINQDGFDDIYVLKFLYDEPAKRHNVFYINNGDGTFTDKAKSMGLDHQGYGIMANFFDYDNDGDLDLYVANQPPNSLRGKAALKNKVSYQYTDKLYRNDKGKFTDVTDQSGITNYTYSLSATSFDYNNDGFLDLFIACDYDEPDIVYKNNGNGTFTNVADTALKHMSNFSMGADVADYNNDGHLDLYVVDMVAEDNFRQKTNMSGMNPERFFALADNGYHYQYMFNALHHNNGDGTFSETAQLAGISNTDWSWTPLFIDLDQDGLKDLLITNGLIKEMRNKDFEIWRKGFFKKKMDEAERTKDKNLYVNPMEISQRAPSFKIANYAYRNEGDMTFSKQTQNWGFDKPTWSQGAAYADFDNDGDLDLVVSNMNMTAGLYRNTANENKLNNYLSVKLEGGESNKAGIGATIKVYTDKGCQVATHTPYRGYMSTSQNLSHFGLGTDGIVNKIEVIWRDKTMTVLNEISANQVLTIKKSDASGQFNYNQTVKYVFSLLDNENITHTENIYDDYKREVLLPYKMSTLGPVLAEGDVNNDGLIDLYLGGAAGYSGQILMNKGNGTFDSNTSPFDTYKQFEDGGALFFDFDNDDDLDLYIAKGGNEYKAHTAAYQDRLYKNDGKGNFSEIKEMPRIKDSSNAVCAFDMDKDGDLDLFVGGRQIPGQYGKNPSSYLLRNDNTRFTDVTNSVAPQLSNIGMVTSAQSTDLDGDGLEEIIIAGEWMDINVLSFKDGKYSNITTEKGLTNTKGWWNTLHLVDIDNDGDKDIVAGNLGHNIKYKASPEKPFKLYVDDFDENGTHDVYLGFYQGDKCYPVRGRQCSSEQMPFVKKKFESYNDFGTATITDVLEGKIDDNTVLQEAQTFSSAVFLNDGSKFQRKALPQEAQMSPIFGIASDDFNKDGKLDLFLAGNLYNREVETTRSDAGKGVMLTYENDKFEVYTSEKTGVSADKDVRDIALLKDAKSNLLVIANNNDAIQIYRY